MTLNAKRIFAAFINESYRVSNRVQNRLANVTRACELHFSVLTASLVHIVPLFQGQLSEVAMQAAL